MFDAEDYRNNKAYEFWSEDRRNRLYNEINDIWEKAQKAREEDNKPSFWHLAAEVWGMQEAFWHCGVWLEFDWVGHRGKWFFPTYEDALMQEEWCYSCID